MKAKPFLRDFLLTFLISFVATVAVTFLWSLIFHGSGTVEWGTAFRLGIVLGIVLPVSRALSGMDNKE